MAGNLFESEKQSAYDREMDQCHKITNLETENARLKKAINKLPSLPTMPDNENDTGFVGCEVQVQTVLQAVDEIKSLSKMFWDLKCQYEEAMTALGVLLVEMEEFHSSDCPEHIEEDTNKFVGKHNCRICGRINSARALIDKNRVR